MCCKSSSSLGFLGCTLCHTTSYVLLLLKACVCIVAKKSLLQRSLVPSEFLLLQQQQRRLLFCCILPCTGTAALVLASYIFLNTTAARIVGELGNHFSILQRGFSFMFLASFRLRSMHCYFICIAFDSRLFCFTCAIKNMLPTFEIKCKTIYLSKRSEAEGRV